MRHPREGARDLPSTDQWQPSEAHNYPGSAPGERRFREAFCTLHSLLLHVGEQNPGMDETRLEYWLINHQP